LCERKLLREHLAVALGICVVERLVERLSVADGVRDGNNVSINFCVGKRVDVAVGVRVC
jgi:hypothetical protein